MNTHEDSSSHRFESAIGGRLNGGKDCPHVAELYASAELQNCSEELQAHLKACPVCNRIIERVRQPINRTPRNLCLSAAERAALKVPVIRNFKAGRVRCIAGHRVFLVLLDRGDPSSTWGRECVFSAGNRIHKFQPAATSVDSLFPWDPSHLILLKIGEDELVFDRDGWGDAICFIGFAFYRSPEQAEAVLQRYEKSLITVDRVPVADQDFEKLIESMDALIRQTLMSWKAVGRNGLRCLDDAMSEMWKAAYLARTCLPANPGEWLLEKAARNLLEKIEERLPDEQVVEPGPAIRKVIDREVAIPEDTIRDVVIREDAIKELVKDSRKAFSKVIES